MTHLSDKECARVDDVQEVPEATKEGGLEKGWERRVGQSLYPFLWTTGNPPTAHPVWGSHSHRDCSHGWRTPTRPLASRWHDGSSPRSSAFSSPLRMTIKTCLTQCFLFHVPPIFLPLLPVPWDQLQAFQQLQEPQSMKAGGEVWCPALSLSALLRTLGERVSSQSPAQALPSEKAPHSRAQVRLPSLQPSGLPSPTAPGQRASSLASPLSRGLGKGGHCAKQATGIRAVKGNQATLLRDVCPQDRASLAKPSEETKGKSANAGGSCLTILRLLPNPPWSSTALRAQPPLRGGDRTLPIFSFSLGHQTLQPISAPSPPQERLKIDLGHHRSPDTPWHPLCLEHPLHPTSSPSLSQIYQASTPLLTKTVASLTSYTSKA